MRWLVEITDIIPNQLFLTDLLAKLNVELYLEDNKTYLISNHFEKLLTSLEVWMETERLRDLISEITSTMSDVHASFKLKELSEQKEDGSSSRYVMVTANTAVLNVIAASKVAATASVGDVSKEEVARLEAEYLERQNQEKLLLIESRVVPAFYDEKALKVYRLLQKDLDPLYMGHVMDLIEADLGKEELNSLVRSIGCKKKLERFYRSINHPRAFGDDSRHIISNNAPPSQPMFLAEAQEFVLRVADLWFKQKYAGYVSK